MADLEKFTADLRAGGKNPNAPPSVISAGKLDRNFARCYPMSLDGNVAPYMLDKSDEGWRLRPAVMFDVCENGTAVKYKFVAERQ